MSTVLTERREVGDVVVDVLDGEGEDLDAHPADIRGSHFTDERRKLVERYKTFYGRN
jgi:hypothetical protein